MFTVAVTGPDGAGKTTIINQIHNIQELPVKQIYMGIMLESGNIVLPTTRLILKMRLARARRNNQVSGDEAGVPSGGERKSSLPGFWHKFTSRAGALLLFANLIAEECYRQIVAWIYLRRGTVVLYDRHFALEMLAYQAVLPIHDQDPLTRLHSRLLRRFYPRPDLVIYLDAPAEVLFARKGERSLAQLEKWRQGYLGLKNDVQNFVVVNANRPVDEVSKEVIDIIWGYHLQRSSLPEERFSRDADGKLRLRKEVVTRYLWKEGINKK